MSIPSPIEQPAVWDTCQIGDTVLPGVCTVEVDRSQKIDVREGAGSDGATETDRGAAPAKVKITCKYGWASRQPIPLNEDDPHALAEAAIQSLMPVPGKTSGSTRKPKAIIHPMARLMKVKGIKIEKISSPKSLGKQMFSFTIEAVEFFPAPKKNATTTPASADATTAVKAGIGGDGSGLGAPKSPYDDAVKSLGQLAGDQLNTGAP